MVSLLLLLVSIIPHTPIIHDHFDHIEINHVYNGKGAHTLDQYLFYRGDHIHAWMMVRPSRRKGTEEENKVYRKKFLADLAKERAMHRAAYRNRYNERPRLTPIEASPPEEVPPYIPPFEGNTPQYRNGQWVLILTNEGYLRRITATAKYHTWTQHDAEVTQRATFEQTKRTGLTKPFRLK